LCREDAFELSSRFGLDSGSNTQLVGIIKEVAPVSGAATDEILGVGEFQIKYFGNNPLYIDQEMGFYKAMGSKSILSQPLPSWNPFKIYSDLKALGARTTGKGLVGNLKGEGLVKGGLFIVDPVKGVVYSHEESTGSCMPYDEIEEVVNSLTWPSASASAPVISVFTPSPSVAASISDAKESKGDL